jgi:hypothetical protein
MSSEANFSEYMTRGLVMANTSKKKKSTKKRGPDAERVKVDGDWTAAVKTALEKQRPKDGWPVPNADKGEAAKKS